MARSVLLIEPDVDLLGELASALRARGLEVAIADDLQRGLERARDVSPEALIVSPGALDTLAEPAAVSSELSALGIPTFILDVAGDSGAAAADFERGGLDEIARRVHGLSGRAGAAVAGGGDVRGNLQQISLADLLQLLAMNRRSGTLSVTTQSGAGEVRVAEGEIVDAVYRRLEGEKALYRLLGEVEGLFSFTSGAPQLFRRIAMPTSKLLMEGMRQIDEARRRRQSLGTEQEALLAIVPADTAENEVSQRVLEAVTAPRTLSELLDEVPASDLDVLTTLEELLAGGQVRRITAGATRIELADSERLTVLAALAKRAMRAGFRPPVRVGIAASPQRLVTLMHAVGRIADAVVPTEAVPTAPIPHTLATLRLGDGVELGVLGLPLVDAYAPLWALVLPGCAAVARFASEPTGLLEAACSVAHVPTLEAETLLREGLEVDPEQAAGLLRALLERAAGAE